MERNVCENDCIFTIFATLCKGFFEPIHLLHAKHTIVRHKPLVSAIQTMWPIHSKCFEIIWIVFSQISVCFISLFLIQSFNWWYFIPIQNNNPEIIWCKNRIKILSSYLTWLEHSPMVWMNAMWCHLSQHSARFWALLFWNYTAHDSQLYSPGTCPQLCLALLTPWNTQFQSPCAVLLCYLWCLQVEQQTQHHCLSSD